MPRNPSSWDGIISLLKDVEQEVSALATASQSLRESGESLRLLVMRRSNEKSGVEPGDSAVDRDAAPSASGKRMV